MRKDVGNFLIFAGVLAFFTVPVFRSGGRTGLTGFAWLVNHTVFGPPVEYVPQEDYRAELESASCRSVIEWWTGVT